MREGNGPVVSDTPTKRLAYPGCDPRCERNDRGGRHYLPCPVAQAIQDHTDYWRGDD